MVRHPKFETLNDYALGRLDDAAEQLVEAHIDACEACLEAVKGVLRVQARFYDAPGPAPLPRGWAERLLENLVTSGELKADAEAVLKPGWGRSGGRVRWRYDHASGRVWITPLDDGAEA